MKIRNLKITVRLSEKEKYHLKEQASLAGLKIEPFVRNLIMNSQMKPHPKEEWSELVRQTSGIANNINQIARNVNSGEDITDRTLNIILDMLNQIWNKLKEF